jgi:hypothetical protein
MLETLISLILIVLIVIRGELSRHAASVRAMSAETNKSIAQMHGTLDGLHQTIVRLWACPICSGFGHNYNLLGESPLTSTTCEACKGTGMKQANSGVKEDT